jgi:hypothetical protein
MTKSPIDEAERSDNDEQTGWPQSREQDGPIVTKVTMVSEVKQEEGVSRKRLTKQNEDNLKIVKKTFSLVQLSDIDKLEPPKQKYLELPNMQSSANASPYRTIDDEIK